MHEVIKALNSSIEFFLEDLEEDPLSSTETKDFYKRAQFEIHF